MRAEGSIDRRFTRGNSDGGPEGPPGPLPYPIPFKILDAIAHVNGRGGTPRNGDSSNRPPQIIRMDVSQPVPVGHSRISPTRDLVPSRSNFEKAASGNHNPRCVRTHLHHPSVVRPAGLERAFYAFSLWNVSNGDRNSNNLASLINCRLKGSQTNLPGFREDSLDVQGRLSRRAGFRYGPIWGKDSGTTSQIARPKWSLIGVPFMSASFLLRFTFLSF